MIIYHVIILSLYFEFGILLNKFKPICLREPLFWGAGVGKIYV